MSDSTLNSSSGQASGDADELSLPLRHYWAIVRKRIWTIIMVICLTVGLATLWAMNQQDVYRASATIEIRTDVPRVLGDVEPVVDPAGGAGYWSNTEFYETEYRKLRSRRVSREVVTALQLENNLEFLGLQDETDPDRLRERLEEIDAVAHLIAMTSVQPVPESHLVQVSVEHTNPELATLLVNTIADVYVDRNIERQLRGTNDAFEWLDDERQQLRERVSQAERTLMDFREEHELHDATMSAYQDLLTDQRADVSNRLSVVQEELSAIRSEQRRIRRALDNGEPESVIIPAVIENPLIQALKQQREELRVELRQIESRYGENQREVRGLLDAIDQVDEAIGSEISNILASYEVRESRAEAREQELNNQLSHIRDEMVALSLAEPSYNQLMRDIQLDTDTLQIIEQRHKEADLYRRQRDVNNIEVLDSAILPTVPIRPRRQQIVLIAAVLGIVLGIGLGFVLELLDNTVKTQEDVERILGLTFLGVVPSIKERLISKSHRRPRGDPERVPEKDLYIHYNPKSTVAETCRSIRTNLQFMVPDRPLRRILITSAGPREGKTSTVISMATVMAQAKNRVLIVDTDMRKPRLHKAFQETNQIGLTNLILGEVSFEEAIKTTVIPNLDILTCGPIPPNPTEIMHTDRFKKVAEELTQRYDRVIFDSPPIIAVADAMILGKMVDGVLLVIKAGQTSTDVAKKAKQLLTGIKAPVLGAILNDLDLEDRAYRYHHYYSYYYHYGQYYEDAKTPGDESEPPEKERAPVPR